MNYCSPVPFFPPPLKHHMVNCMHLNKKVLWLCMRHGHVLLQTCVMCVWRSYVLTTTHDQAANMKTVQPLDVITYWLLEIFRLRTTVFQPNLIVWAIAYNVSATGQKHNCDGTTHRFRLLDSMVFVPADVWSWFGHVDSELCFVTDHIWTWSTAETGQID